MKKKHRIIAALVLLVLLLCAAALWLLLRPKQQEDDTSHWTAFGTAVFLPADQVSDEPALGEGMSASAEDGTERAPYLCPIDFETLQAENPDIYAWMTIEGTEISYPLVQREDDTFYLTHGSDGAKASEGAIFSESRYNTTTMEDGITVLYGHRMKSGAMFGRLQMLYSSMELLREHSEITVYLPEQGYRYQVFAAVPFSKEHIMYYYGYGAARARLAFLQRIRAVKSLDAYVDDTVEVSSADRLLVLSTCLYGDSSKRFLVVAKQTEIF